MLLQPVKHIVVKKTIVCELGSFYFVFYALLDGRSTVNVQCSENVKVKEEYDLVRQARSYFNIKLVY